MKRVLYGIILLLFTASLSAETEVGGSLKVDLRSLIKEPYCNFYNREDILTLKISSDVSDNVSIYASIQGRYFDRSNLVTFEDLKNRNSVDPFSVDLWESYISISSFIFDNMDAVIGKQIVEWGTADMLNPTSNLNPHDLSDPLDFSKRLPITMFNFTYYPPWNQFNAVQFIWIPAHKPALMPPGEMPMMKMDVPTPPDLEAMNNLNIANNPMASKMEISSSLNQYVHHNPFYPKYSEGGIRLSLNFFQTDFHLSYFNGYGEFPLPAKAEIRIANESEINSIIQNALKDVAPGDNLGTMLALATIEKIPVDIESNITLVYPHYHVVGADFKADISGVGVWGEAGYFIPYELDITYIYPDFQWMMNNELNYIVQNREFGVRYKSAKYPVLDKPFLKYTIGAEYIFKGGYHFEAQFAHGFFFEQGSQNLNNYLMLELDKSFMEGKFKLTLSGGGSVEGGTFAYFLKNFKLPEDLSTGAFGGPRLDYYPYDGITVTLGAIFLGGSGNSFFAKMKKMEQIFLQLESSF